MRDSKSFQSPKPSKTRIFSESKRLCFLESQTLKDCEFCFRVQDSKSVQSVRTRSAVSVWAQNTIGRAMRQTHSGIWQSLTRSRRLIPGGLGDRHPHASALTGRTELSFGPLVADRHPLNPSALALAASPVASVLAPMRLRLQ